MQTMDRTGLEEGSDPGLAERLGGGIARGAALVAGLTILSRRARAWSARSCSHRRSAPLAWVPPTSRPTRSRTSSTS